MHDLLYQPLRGAEHRDVNTELLNVCIALEQGEDVSKPLAAIATVVWHIYQHAQKGRDGGSATHAPVSIEDLQVLAKETSGIELPKTGTTMNFYRHAAEWLAMIWDNLEELRLHNAPAERKERIKKFLLAWSNVYLKRQADEFYRRYPAA